MVYLSEATARKNPVYTVKLFKNGFQDNSPKPVMFVTCTKSSYSDLYHPISLWGVICFCLHLWMGLMGLHFIKYFHLTSLVLHMKIDAYMMD